MSQWLDGQSGLVSLVAGDLRRQGVRETGRRGLPAESVLRCALLKQQRQLRLAKKRARAIEYSRGHDKKRQLYRELIAAARASRAELQAVAAGLVEIAGTAAERWRAEVDHYLPLIARIIAQSQRRVLDGEAVPADEKLVSLFEPHADIIVKGVVRCSTDTSSTWPPARAG